MGMKKKRQIDVSRGKLGMDASPKPINENKLRLSTTESASNFMPRSRVSRRSDSGSEANVSCCHNQISDHT